jgi:hypothetical protein
VAAQATRTRCTTAFLAGMFALVGALATATVQPATAAALLAPAANGDLAWVDDDGLWVGDPYGQHRVRIGPGRSLSTWSISAPAWSRAGDRLAQVRDDEIWVMNPDGTDRRRIASVGLSSRIISVPSWFAGDTKVLVVQRGISGTRGWLVWHAVDGTQSAEIALPGHLPVREAAVSPDGTRIVLAGGTSEDSTAGIYTVGIDGTGLRRLTGGFGLDELPSWSPDGTMIAFTNYYAEPGPIETRRAIVMNADGSGGRLLQTGATVVTWSPDGRSLVLRDPYGGPTYTVRPDGTNPTPLGGCAHLETIALSWRPVPTPPAGTVRAWGWNGVGQLGDGTTADRRLPSSTGLSGVVAVASGYYHSLALRRDGTVWAWGWNGVGQLGNGTTADSHVPVHVAGLSNVTCLAAGAFHNLAVRADGTVWTWGWNHFGQLGGGTTADALRPRLVPGLTAKSVAGGIAHSLALGRDGTVWGWGWNGLGQVGNGSAYDSHRPVAVAGPGVGKHPVRTIAAGGHHSLAGVNNGVLGWGWNEFGQLGNGTTANWVIPVGVTGAGGPVIQVAAGAFHSLALRADGTVVAWGDNTAGELGDGTTTRALQARPVALATPVSAVRAGLLHSLAISRGELLTWGWNPYGQLGDGFTTDRLLPTRVLGARVDSVAAGALHSLAA